MFLNLEEIHAASKSLAKYTFGQEHINGLPLKYKGLIWSEFMVKMHSNLQVNEGQFGIAR